MTDGYAIEVKGLGHSFGARTVLKDFSFSVPRSATAALTGPNGSGKSTLIALLANLYGVRSGVVTVLGHDITRAAPAALAGTGIVFQRPALDLDLTVAENLAYHAALHGCGRRHAAAVAAMEVERQGLVARMNSRVRELSVGQRRRVEIARALMLEPRLLLLDEPTAALDGQGRALLLARIAELKSRRGTAVLWASHEEEEIASADMVLRIAGGRLA